MPQNIQFPELTAASEFSEPRKLIHTQDDVVVFHSTVAYARITAFIHFICDAMPDCSLKRPPSPSPTIQRVLVLLETCNQWIEQCPLQTGARRFGNLAFRTWHNLLESQSRQLIVELLGEGLGSASVEVVPYFTGSFGSSQRLDYGTGHELSFFAFLCTLFQLNLLSTESSEDAKCVGLLVYPAYLSIIQKLIVKYTLEPAGSHGVWGLDDTFAMPYLLGAAQLSHLQPETFPTPASIMNKKDVEEYRGENLYFAAINFINDLKKGPFWEHSPMLYNISGIDNWAKISMGMRKLYNAEVLGKFPVVQHFPFGNCFFPFTPVNGHKHTPTAQKGPTQDNLMSELKQVQDYTETLHVSEVATRCEGLQADTPILESQPTKANKQQHAESSKPQTTSTKQESTTAPWMKACTQSSSRSLPHANLMTTPRFPTSQSNDLGSTRLAGTTVASDRPIAGRELGLAHDGRTKVPVTHPDPSVPLSAHPYVNVVPKASDQLDEEDEERANVEGMEDGIGIEGQPGTKAPFSGARIIHPAVLESMRQRGELR